MKTKVLQIAIFIFALLVSEKASANFEFSIENNICTHEIDYCNDPYIREAIEDIVLDEMTIWRHPTTNEATYATSCRNQNGGCEAHVERVVNLIFDLSCESGYDPYRILAIAKHESNYNPFAINKSSGAVGLLQLMPRSPFAQSIRYIQDPLYRNECREDETYCQQEVIHASFRLLHRSIGRCGDFNSGLGMYGSGSCQGSKSFVRFVNSYAEQVRLQSVLIAEVLGSQNGSTSYRTEWGTNSQH